jgi:hypothetical protein
MPVTVADYRVDKMHDALVEAMRALTRLKQIEADLAQVREALEAIAEAVYDGTIYDPEGERTDA